MQFSILSTIKKSSFSKYLILGLKVSFFLAMLFFVIMKLWQHQDSWYRMLQQLQEGWQSPANRWALLALLLVPLNWLLEAVKWQVLARRVKASSLWHCTQAVLAGLCLGLVTPRSLGDYAGRILVHGGQEKERLVGAVLLNRIVQSLVTFITGIAGVLLLVWQLGLWQSEELLWLLVPAFLGTLLMLLLMGPLKANVLRWLQRKLGQKVVRWVDVINEYSLQELLVLNAWALLRYAVFSLQFLFLLWWAGIAAPVPLLLAAVAATFLLKSLLPAFNFLSDLGVREFSALLVFSGLALPHAEVIAASLLLWMMNICLPALAGLPVVLQLKQKVV